jgi:hypothetical protein
MGGWSRPAGAAAVVLLHAALIWALLITSHPAGDKLRAIAAREIFFTFPPPSRHPPQQRAVRSIDRATAPVTSAMPAPPDYRGITLPDTASAAPPPGALQGSLFGCADLDKLSPEERTRCGRALAVPPNAVDFHDGVSRSQQAALWERGRLRKNGPLLLPCMNPQGAPNPLAVAACLAKGAVEGGFDPNQQPSYADTPTITHLPNNGDPPDKPTYGP